MTVKQTLIYLDHNALSSFLDKNESICKVIEPYTADQSYQFIFSDENLKEIHKSKGYEHQFLELVTRLKAKYFFPEVGPNNRPTDRYFIKEVDWFEYYDSFLRHINEWTKIEKMLSGYSQKMHGGLKNKSYSEILNEGIETLLERLNNDVRGTDFEHLYRGHVDFLSEQLNQISDSEISESVDNYKSDAPPVKDLDLKLGGPRELNNIKPPKVLDQIWKLAKEKIPDTPSFEEFFGIDPKHHFPEDENAEFSKIEKISMLYNALNMYGYFRDKKLKRERQFMAFLSDASHSTMGYLADIIISSDERFVMKTVAIYEYLNIPKTIIQNIPEKNTNITFKLSLS